MLKEIVAQKYQEVAQPNNFVRLPNHQQDSKGFSFYAAWQRLIGRLLPNASLLTSQRPLMFTLLGT